MTTASAIANDTELRKLRDDMESGLASLYVVNREDLGCVGVVAMDGSKKKDNYTCLRYFTIAGEWVCSIDVRNAPVSVVWKWLNKPGVVRTEEV